MGFCETYLNYRCALVSFEVDNNIVFNEEKKFKLIQKKNAHFIESPFHQIPTPQAPTQSAHPQNVARQRLPHAEGSIPETIPSRTSCDATTLCATIAATCCNATEMSHRLLRRLRESDVSKLFRYVMGNTEE